MSFQSSVPSATYRQRGEFIPEISTILQEKYSIDTVQNIVLTTSAKGAEIYKALRPIC